MREFLPNPIFLLEYLFVQKIAMLNHVMYLRG